MAATHGGTTAPAHTHTPGATLRRLVALRFTTIVAAAYTHTPRRYSLSHARRHAPEHAHTPSASVHAWARRRQRGGTVSPPSKREKKKKDVYRELREFRIGVGDPSAHARQHPVAAVQRSTQPDDTRRASPLTQPARSAFLLMPRTAQCGGVGCCSTQTRREKEGGSTRTPAQQRWRQGNLKKKKVNKKERKWRAENRMCAAPRGGRERRRRHAVPAAPRLARAGGVGAQSAHSSAHAPTRQTRAASHPRAPYAQPG